MEQTRPAPSSPSSFRKDDVIAHLSGARDFIDVRFRVTPEMAGASQLYILDESTGKIGTVGAVPKIGRLMTQNSRAGGFAFILFRSPDNAIKAGSLITLVVGSYKRERIPVQ